MTERCKKREGYWAVCNCQKNVMPILIQAYAHSFIENTYWENAYEEVRALLPASDLYLFSEENTIKGFIGTIDGAYIAGLFVREQHQSNGVGHALLNHCKQRYPRLELDVFVQNEKAVRFYRANGFSITETKPNADCGGSEYHMVWMRTMPTT